MKVKELQRVKAALLKELDATLQKYCHQRLNDVMNDFRIHCTDIKPESSPDDVFSIFLRSGVLKTYSAAPMVRMRESLERLRLGTFGLCARCGRKIPPKYLEINPTTIHCESCSEESKKLISQSGLRGFSY
jgi:RNA polymerase-binding transcription factor DksA